MKVTGTHVYFYRDFYSQWHILPFTDDKGNTFNCAEQAMMYEKAMLFNDTATAAKIMAETYPGNQKALGREVKGYVDAEWDAVRLDVVTKINYFKFSQNEKIKNELCVTHKDKILVEASAIDPIWGVGLWEDDVAILDEANWKGQNLLGIAVMGAREMILEEESDVIVIKNSLGKTKIYKSETKVGVQG